MGSSADVTLLLALAASVFGVGVALAMWRRQVRRSRADRRTHPSMQSPISLAAVAADQSDAAPEARRWHVSVRPDAAPVSIDIVMFRATASQQAWRSEPIIEPVRIEPGNSIVLPSEFAPAPAYDVVVGWTVHQPTGEVPASRTFSVLDTRAGATVGAPVDAARGRPHLDLLVVGLLLAAIALTTWGVLARSDDERATGAPATTPTTPVTMPLTTTTRVTTSTTTVPATAATSAPTTTDAPSTTDAPATTTTTPATTTPVTSVVDGPRVDITATIGDCRFGTDCLIAGFTISGFETPPSRYVCEFADGSRIEFGFGGDGVEAACATGSADAAITIEIGGVQSKTVTRASVDDG